MQTVGDKTGLCADKRVQASPTFMIVERNESVPDNIVELDRHEYIGGYTRQYGNEIASLYEDLNVIYLPHFPLAIDLKLFQALVFPEGMMKIGTRNGIDSGLVKREGTNFNIDDEHVLVRTVGDFKTALYIRSQIASVNAQIREAIRALFPMYHSITLWNLTWRLTPTEGSGLHLDTFGTPGERIPRDKRWHRIKFFINLDDEPRRWWTSYTLPETLKQVRGHLPGQLPDDINHVNYLIDNCGGLDDLPYHKIQYPTLSAVFGNAEAVTHAVRYGRRMVAGEFLCEYGDMLNPGKFTHTQFPRWLADADIGLAL